MNTYNVNIEDNDKLLISWDGEANALIGACDDLGLTPMYLLNKGIPTNLAFTNVKTNQVDNYEFVESLTEDDTDYLVYKNADGTLLRLEA